MDLTCHYFGWGNHGGPREGGDVGTKCEGSEDVSYVDILEGSEM